MKIVHCRRVMSFLWMGLLWCTAAQALAPAIMNTRRELSQLYAHYLKAYLLQKSSGGEDKPLNVQQLTVAYKEYNTALGYFKDSSRIHMNMGIVSMALNNFPQAEELLKKSLDLDKDNLSASVVLALLYAHLKDEGKMNQVYEVFLKQAQRLQPENIQINEYLGQFYLENGKIDEAINVYSILVKAHPEYVNGYFWLGYLNEERGNRQQAITNWERTLQLEPNHADALNCLGYLYAEEGVKLNEAVFLVKKALESRPDESAYMDSLGWIYFKQGDLSRAEYYLKKAAERLQDPVIYYHLGELYKSLKRPDDACAWWQKSYQLDKTKNPAAERISHDCSKQQ